MEGVWLEGQGVCMEGDLPGERSVGGGSAWMGRPPSRQTPYTVNRRAVCIPLECKLVLLGTNNSSTIGINSVSVFFFHFVYFVLFFYISRIKDLMIFFFYFFHILRIKDLMIRKQEVHNEKIIMNVIPKE